MDVVLIVFLILVFLFLIISGVTIFIIVNRRYWKFKYVILENIGGSGYVITGRGRCRLVNFGDGGEEIFFLKRSKKWRVAYGKRIGKNQVAWAIGQDGYWYNVHFGDLDKRLAELGVNPVDRDMRYAYASVRKGVENRYNQKSFMEKYGTVIAFGMLFLCIIAMAGMIWIGQNGNAKIAAINSKAMETAKEVLDSSNNVVSKLANLGISSSGYTSGGKT